MCVSMHIPDSNTRRRAAYACVRVSPGEYMCADRVYLCIDIAIRCRLPMGHGLPLGVRVSACARVFALRCLSKGACI